jgi:hypothetical protein
MGVVDFDGVAGWPGFTWPAGARAGGEIAIGDIFAIIPLEPSPLTVDDSMICIQVTSSPLICVIDEVWVVGLICGLL